MVFAAAGTATVDAVAAIVGKRGGVPSTEGKVAVDDVTLSIRTGERLGIIGRNGAGKSTLLHMIAGISDPTKGTIHINGKVTSIMTLGIGLRNDLTGRENIYIDGEIQGQTRADVDRVIDEVIEFADLGEFIDHPVRTYSTGMTARLAFAMITHIEPEILIIDEALSVGDAAFSAKATAKIREICARGKIVILVSHSMQAIRKICNRCIYMRDGKVVMDSSPEEVTRAYIDEVRGEDEAALIERFRSLVGSRSTESGTSIDRLSLHSGEDSVEVVYVEAGQRLRIRIHGRLRPTSKAETCRVRIVRLDDLVVFHREFRLADYASDNDEVGIEIEFDSLHLGAAVYRLDAQFINNEQVCNATCAESSIVFEIFTLVPPEGGKPMLYYPVELVVSRL
jgi:lipopolysaccharide transport system ATP-binding protein